MENKNKCLIIGHNDMDGYMSTYLQAYKFMYCYPDNIKSLDDIDIFNIDYDDIDKLFKQLDFKQYTKIAIVDLNLTEEQADYIHNNVAPSKTKDYSNLHYDPSTDTMVVYENFNIADEEEEEKEYRERFPLELIDHHISGKKVADKYFWYHLDSSKSATMLVYDTITDEKLKDQISKIGKFTYGEYLDNLVKSINAADIFDKTNTLDFRVGRIISKMQKEIENRIKFAMPFFSKNDEWNKFKLIYHTFIKRLIQQHCICNQLECINEEGKLAYNLSSQKSYILQDTIIEFYEKALDLKNFNIKYPTIDEYEVVMLGESIIENYTITEHGQYSIHRYFSSSYDKGTNKVTPLNLLIVYGMELNNMSDVADYIINNSKYNMIAFRENNYVWSLYCSDEYDVSSYCKSKGGGGHKRAAGFTYCDAVDEEEIGEEKFDTYINNICNYVAEEIMKFYEHSELDRALMQLDDVINQSSIGKSGNRILDEITLPKYRDVCFVNIPR